MILVNGCKGIGTGFSTDIQPYNPETLINYIKSYLQNETRYNFNENNSLIFETRENKEKSFTEFYNLIYQYQNDCLIASIRYNKEYYTNSSLKPNEELFFNITLIPLGSTQTDSILD